MSSAEENSSSSSQSPIAKKIRKQWKFDPSIPIPKSTYYRQQKNLRSLKYAENRSSTESLVANGSNNSESSESDVFTSLSTYPPSKVETSEYDTDNKDNSGLSEPENDSSSFVPEDNLEVDQLENNLNNSFHQDNPEYDDDDDNSRNSLNQDNSDPDDLGDSSSSLRYDTSESSSLGDDTDNSIDADFLTNIDTEDDSSDDLDTEHFRSMADPFTKLYDDSHATLIQGVLLVMNFYVMCKLSKFSLQVLLDIFQKMLPQPNKMPKTLYHLFKFVEDASASFQIIKHYYCKKCLYYNGNKTPVIVCSSCSSTDGFSYFYEIDLVDLIRYMFEERNLWNKLQSSNQEDGSISDITNGSEYLRVTANKKNYDLTLLLNTDGLSIVKSAKSHCWPLMFMIAELPEYLRESFICVMGLWYDTDRKPLMNPFLQPFCQKLVKCYHEGITWVHPVTKEKCISRIIVPLFIADAPARAEIQNIMYFNSKYGCSICEIKTQRCTRVEGKKTIRAYIFRETPSLLRNGDRMEQQALEVFNNNLKHKRGVKGLSVISALPLLDLGTCVLPEYMHSVLLGVGKQFFNLWIKENGNWNIKRAIPEIDQVLLKIRPPHFFNRMPRSLTLLKYFKASEFYNLILFYSLPILVDHLPDDYLQHWILLVAAIFNLLKRSICELDLQQSELLLKLFVRDIGGLYSDRQYTYNVHQLLHLVLCIRRWGPLWSTSAFPFENMNGILARCVHGSKHLGQEMIKNLKIAQGVQCLNIMCQSNENQLNCSNEHSFQILEKKNISLEDTHLREFILSLGLDIENIKCYSRSKINKDIFTSKYYKTTKTNSYTIKVEIANKLIYGEIQIFIETENELHIVIKPLIIDQTRMFCHRSTNKIIQHILPVTEENKLMCFKLNDVKCITHMIRITSYICELPNTLRKVM